MGSSTPYRWYLPFLAFGSDSIVYLGWRDRSDSKIVLWSLKPIGNTRNLKELAKNLNSTFYIYNYSIPKNKNEDL